ncbi:MAG: 3-oxoacyl-ACP reductase FabG [Fidelibacterota bacterium]
MNGNEPTALVTGGSSGIGKAIVIKFARSGINVAFTYRPAPNKNERIKEMYRSIIPELMDRLYPISADVRESPQAEAVVKNIIDRWKTLHILVNCAGITRDSVIWKMSEQSWDDVMNTNLKGAFLYIKAVTPVFRENRYGKIVNITSINALRGKFGQANYSSSKAGLIGLTKSAALELGKYSINVNAVAPGMIETEMISGLAKEIIERAKEETVFKRLGTPEDVANLVAFLCSDEAKHITGEVIKIDGGQYI